MATIREKSYSTLVLVLLCTLFAYSMMSRASAEPTAQQCQEEKKLGFNACKMVLYGRPPSPGCCERVRVTDIECVCSMIPPGLAAHVDINRAIRLVEGCGRTVPRNFKCGSITTPP